MKEIWTEKEDGVFVYLLCVRYPAMSSRAFLGMDRNSLWTCCFHDNSLFFCVSVKDWPGREKWDETVGVDDTSPI